MGNDCASEFMAAYMRKGPWQPGHLPRGEDGIGVAVRCCCDAEVVWVRGGGHKLVGVELVGRLVAVELLGTHVSGESGGCHGCCRLCRGRPDLDWGPFGCRIDIVVVASKPGMYCFRSVLPSIFSNIA